ncbi:MAG: DNA mismatch repair protein MutS [Bacillota bacterium]
MAKLTPMLEQYLDIKAEYKDCILFFRLGDFYEMFGEDAKLASRLLDITLTSREAGKGNRIPMCGVPYHASLGYIARLVKQGHKVAICEQVEDPAKARGLVKRQVVRVVTPGTVVDEQMLDSFDNNYIASVSLAKEHIGLAWMDVTTGEFYVSQTTTESEMFSELYRIHPSEIIIADTSDAALFAAELKQAIQSAVITRVGPSQFDYESCVQRLCDHFQVPDLTALGCSDQPEAVQAAGALLSYVSDMQKTSLEHINTLVIRTPGEFMQLDRVARRNLELTSSLGEEQRKGTLLSVLDRTETPMGSRTLRQWIEQPLMSVDDITRRLDAVEEAVSDLFLREGIAESLKGIQDLERLCGRVVMGTATPRDLVSLRNSLSRLRAVKDNLSHCTSELFCECNNAIDLFEDLVELLARAIVDDPPAVVRDGGVIRSGYNGELDELRQLKSSGRNWIAGLERSERERTGIKSLRIGYNQVFGYYIEVTKPNLDLVPSDYIRKQTLANAERFVTPELKAQEEKILSAEERCLELEKSLLEALLDEVKSYVHRIRNAAAALGVVDTLVSLSKVALESNYCRPEVHTGLDIEIIDGRHPVVETMEIEGRFVPNDTKIVSDSDQILIITGPNMSGKSTYLRQVALITIMAQMGSFVPASSASIGLVDRIFTRIGASDDLAAGKSTFMVEMSEVSVILSEATTRSLIILDEVGRGTSTYDGISIAWAVVEYLHEKKGLRPRTLFATHYHELTDLESMYQRVKNYRVDVSDEGDQVVFLHRIVEGGADKSYGIEVARRAGLPRSVISRARHIQSVIEKQTSARLVDRLAASESATAGNVGEPRASAIQASLFDTAIDEIIQELAKVDCSELTPIQALTILHDFSERAREGVRWCQGE